MTRTNPLRPRGERWEKVCAFHRVRPGYWFSPKLYGYGATPVTWQGWALTGLFVLLVVMVTSLAVQDNPVLFAMLGPITVGFILLCHAKTDGDWKWRWGTD